MVATRRPSTVPLLTTQIQLCLAHYCDLHGPTPLMVTEGLPVSCSQCHDDVADSDRPSTSAASGPSPTVTDALRKMTLSSSRSSSAPVSEHDAQNHRATMRRSPAKQPVPSSLSHASPAGGAPIDTPPLSPGKTPEARPEPSSAPGSRRDDNFRRTYDESVTKRAGPCQNCALTLPKRQDSADSAGAESKLEQQGPTLRTRTPYARVFGHGDDISPPPSNPQSSYNSDTEEDSTPTGRSRSLYDRRPTTSTCTSRSSVSSRTSVTPHTHYLDYTSTHEPSIANTFSIIRASCLRTLSFETLPRRSDSSQSGGSISSPLSAMPPTFPSPPSGGLSGSSYIGPNSGSQSATNGGPIFFGDPLAGYTTAYIFRVPDVHARGRKRVYAFMALSTTSERLAMKAFGQVSSAFRDLAVWIQELAEREAEREREREDDNGSAIAALNAAYSKGAYAGFGNGGPRDSGVGLGGGSGAERERDHNRSESSFLSCGNRGSGLVQRMGGSMGPGGFAPKARGLAELVGLPDFFIELHARFVRLLLELGIYLAA